MTPDPSQRPDLCVIGGGTAGHALAFAAAALGARCTLVDPRERLGVGQAADLAEAMLIEAAHGGGGSAFHLPGWQRRLGLALADLTPTHAAERLRTVGVTWVQAAASFADAGTILAGGQRIRARRFVLACGGRAAPLPWMAGLDPERILQPAGLAALARLPDAVAVVAEIPEGLAWAQALARLGVDVTLVAAPGATVPFDPELIDPVVAALGREGVALWLDHAVVGAETSESGVRLHIRGRGNAPATTIAATRVLVARHREPAIAGLALDRAGIECAGGAPLVDRGLRTTNRRVWAIGDVLGGRPTTDAAVPDQVGLVLRAALFRQPVRFRDERVPRLLRTAPAVAQVGAPAGAAKILRWPLAETLGGVATGAQAGGVKVAATAGGRVLGAGIVGPAAAEAMVPWALALAHKIPLGAMAGLPAQTGLAEASRRAGLGFLALRLGGPWARRLLALLRRLP